MIQVPLQRLPHGRDVSLPAYQTEHAAGMDLCAVPRDGEPITVPPGEVRLIPCGFAMAVPVGYEAQVRPRSGLSTKHRVGMPNAPGTIDADYRGEVMVPLINHGDADFVVTPGMRVAQMLVLPVPRVSWTEVEELPATSRGSGGFGHTGA